MSYQDLIKSVESAESGGRDYGNDGGVLTSPKGAKGRMQVMDTTNTDPGFGVKPAQDNSVEERARVGRDYIGAMIQKYGDPIKAIAAYNWGPGNLDKAIAKHGDDWMSAAPAETQKYVQIVSKHSGNNVTESAPSSEPKQPNRFAGYQSDVPPNAQNSTSPTSDISDNSSAPKGNRFAGYQSEDTKDTTSSGNSVYKKGHLVTQDKQVSSEDVNPAIDALHTIGSRMGHGLISSLDNIGYNVGRVLGTNPEGQTPEDIKQRGVEINDAAYKARTRSGEAVADTTGKVLDTALGWIPRGFAKGAEALGADESAAQAVGDMGAMVLGPKIIKGGSDAVIGGAKAAGKGIVAVGDSSLGQLAGSIVTPSRLLKSSVGAVVLQRPIEAAGLAAAAGATAAGKAIYNKLTAGRAAVAPAAEEIGAAETPITGKVFGKDHRVTTQEEGAAMRNELADRRAAAAERNQANGRDVRSTINDTRATQEADTAIQDYKTYRAEGGDASFLLYKRKRAETAPQETAQPEFTMDEIRALRAQRKAKAEYNKRKAKLKELDDSESS